jgi:PAS domain S-box-containing protein
VDAAANNPPPRRPRRDRRASVRPSGARVSGRAVRLLVIDDDLVDRTACRRALPRAGADGFKLYEAATAAEGLECVRRVAPDCVLLDYRLPDLDGLQFLERLDCASVPVIMLTGMGSETVAVEAIKRGARDYLIKDFERRYLGLLPSVIERVLREQHALQEKRRAEIRLRESEARFRTLADTAPVLIWMHGPNRRCTFFNRSWLEFTGRTLAQQLRAGSMASVHPEHRQRWLAVYRSAFEQRTPFRIEYRLRRGDGQYRWMLDHGTPRFETDGPFAGYVGSCVDITERKEAEDALRHTESMLRRQASELEAADRRKDEFLAMLAHELRNPLAPIRSTLDMFTVTKLAMDPLVSSGLEVIGRQVTHMTRLVGDLLDVARITQGRIELRKESVELAEVVRQAVESNRPRIESRRQELAVELPPHPIRLTADPVRLTQVIGNLLDNATRYGRADGRITVAAHRQERDAIIIITDDGTGIPADALPHVFDVFFQADTTLDRTRGGLGLGLALVRRVVELHEGTIEAASAGRGHGAIFTLRLPLQPGDTPPQ